MLTQPAPVDHSPRYLRARNHPWTLLFYVSDIDWWHRSRHYKEFLALVSREPLRGQRDALLRRARKVFGATIPGMRADLVALSDLATLERMATLPTRGPRR